jgi:hypothetical protein
MVTTTLIFISSRAINSNRARARLSKIRRGKRIRTTYSFDVIGPLWSSNDIKKMLMRVRSWLWIRPEKLDFSVSYSRTARNAQSLADGPIGALADRVYQ